MPDRFSKERERLCPDSASVPRIGVQPIDDQHLLLLEHARRFEDSLRRRDASGETARLFAFLSDYARFHFEDEEALMRSVGYPALEAHARQHAELTARLRSLEHHFEDEGDSASLIAVLSGLVRRWLVEHLAGTDQELGRFLREHPP